jgi:hypothetical protein
MGLDMYLTKKNSMNSKIEQDVVYWRKANQIHKWFVDNVQGKNDNCNQYFVSKEKLKDLIELCKKVLNKELDAKTYLPTQSKFFFGSLEYDEYYYRDLQNTITQLTPLLEEKGEFYYTSSW